MIAILVGAPFLAMTMLSLDQIPNVYGLYLVATVIPFLTAFFLIFGVVDTLCLKVKLYVRAGTQLLSESQIIHSEKDFDLQ